MSRRKEKDVEENILEPIKVGLWSVSIWSFGSNSPGLDRGKRRKSSWRGLGFYELDIEGNDSVTDHSAVTDDPVDTGYIPDINI